MPEHFAWTRQALRILKDGLSVPWTVASSATRQEDVYMSDKAKLAKGSIPFNDLEIIECDVWYNSFKRGIVSYRGQNFYAICEYEDSMDNPDYDPEDVRSVNILSYQLFALHNMEAMGTREPEEGRKPERWAKIGRFFERELYA